MVFIEIGDLVFKFNWSIIINDDTESDQLLPLGDIYETLHDVDSGNISFNMVTVHEERVDCLMVKGLDSMSPKYN